MLPSIVGKENKYLIGKLDCPVYLNIATMPSVPMYLGFGIRIPTYTNTYITKFLYVLILAYKYSLH